MNTVFLFVTGSPRKIKGRGRTTTTNLMMRPTRVLGDAGICLSDPRILLFSWGVGSALRTELVEVAGFVGAWLFLWGREEGNVIKRK